MITHLLDTSAWLIHLLQEPGSEAVTALLLNSDHRVGVSVLSLVEVQGRMRQMGIELRFAEIVEEYRNIFAEFLVVDEPVALQATELRKGASTRLPAVDSLIAATAAHHNATLVHRDPHFAGLTAESVSQLALDGR